MRVSAAAVVAALGVAVAACGASPKDASSDEGSALASEHHKAFRDWSTYPAVVDVPPAPVIFALSDIHGGYDRAAALLAANGVIAGVPSSPGAVRWAAGDAVLLVVGDLVDKGPQPLETIDLLRALERDAAARGGRVVVTLGNHEAEFMVDPKNGKAQGEGGFDDELSAHGIAPKDVASGSDARGAWLRSLPLAARVGAWFFAHAGDTGGRSMKKLEKDLESALDAHHDFDDPELVGSSSILESRDWYEGKHTADDAASALGVRHIVFGHDPNALGSRGAIAFTEGGALTRIDCGLSPLVNDSSGKLLRVRVVSNGASDVAEELDASGNARMLFVAPHGR